MRNYLPCHLLRDRPRSPVRPYAALLLSALYVFGGAGCTGTSNANQTAANTSAKPVAASNQPITVFTNANVLTMTEAQPTASTVVIQGDLIIAVGDDTVADDYKKSRKVNLAGKTLMPGFNDTHIHIDGNAPHYVDLTQVTSIAEMQRLVSKRAKKLGKNSWITGYGWSEDELSEGRKPNRFDLDNAAPSNPVVLTRAGAHSAVASSSALALAGFDKTSVDPENGSLERDAEGELTGIIRERQDIVLALVPPASESELTKSLSANLKDLFALGITSITQASADEATLMRWQQVYALAPTEHPRAAVQLLWPGKQKFAAFEGRSGQGDKHFRIGPLKVFVDGGFTGPAAYTKEPYRGEETYRGKLALSEEELKELLEIAHAAGWQMGIHAIGDAAIELVVEELVNVLARAPRDYHRHYLNHFTVMPDEATMKSMAANDIWITQQPNFTYTLEGRYSTYLDGERLSKNNALKTPMDHGIFMALSSDILPIGPMTGIYAAVTRRGMSGTQYGPEEALSVQEALQGYTRNAAYFTFEESIKGTIEVGKLADLVVLEADPLSVAAADLLTLEVEQTWLGGKRVFKK